MIHKMKLQESPFKRIISGEKTIEFRLYDEKRQEVKIGDKIEFSKLPDLKEKIVVEVLDLYRADNFYDLFARFYSDEEAKKKADSMLRFYSHEEEEKYGVLGIKINLLKTE